MSPSTPIEAIPTPDLKHIYNELQERLWELDSKAEFPMSKQQSDVLSAVRNEALAILTELVQRERGTHREPG